MKNKKDLQKLTDSKIEKILSLEQITHKDLKQLNDKGIKQLQKIVFELINNANADERDNLYKKIELIITKTTKNQLWEYNHGQITWAMSSLINEYGRIPTKTEIALKTELSRQTVHKHFKEYSNNPVYLEQIEQFKFMYSTVMANVFQFAVKGDMSAAKLYLNVLGFMNNKQAQNKTLVHNQNNYIQINGTVLSQETIKQLKPEQLNIIENILKTINPEQKELVIENKI